MSLHIHIHHPDDRVNILLQQILKELKKMPSLDDLQAAVTQAVTDVVAQVQDAVTKETAEVVTQIKAIPVGTVLTQEFIDGLIAQVKGIGTAASTAVDTISQNDGGAPPA